jgi:hypothetical protein
LAVVGEPLAEMNQAKPKVPLGYPPEPTVDAGETVKDACSVPPVVVTLLDAALICDMPPL